MGFDGGAKEQIAEQSMFLNELSQVFIDTVRASGGNNPNRHLLVTPYAASLGVQADDSKGRIEAFVDRKTGALRLSDPRGRLIVSIHYYEPWAFACAPEDSEWFTPFFDMDNNSIAWNVGQVFQIIEENFTAHGIPIIMGETGAMHRPLPNGSSNDAERIKWVRAYIGGLRERGIPSIIWDDGGSFGLLDRQNLKWLYPEYVNTLLEVGREN